MKSGANYIVDILKNNNVKHIFGIPGASIIEFLYAADRAEDIEVHLSYHEQAAAFAAAGIAQVGCNLGVVYSTKGPGFINTLTAVGDCYFDSVPLLVITAHNNGEGGEKRFLGNQEIKTESIAKSISKDVVLIETKKDLHLIDIACKCALEDRKGPVIIDINSGVLKDEVGDDELSVSRVENENKGFDDVVSVVGNIEKIFDKSSRPIVLIGAGLVKTESIEKLKTISSNLGLPIMSSRVAQDRMKGFDNYFGYIGSRGIRYSNFILEKADCILSLGNRMAYPIDSLSYKDLMDNKTIIRIDIDRNEFERKIPNSINHFCDLNAVIDELYQKSSLKKDLSEWRTICNMLRVSLQNCDINKPVRLIADILGKITDECCIVGDVGNNAIWLSKAYSIIKNTNRLIYPHSFAALGSGVCRSIGVYYASGRPVYCVIGDQGMQLNIQELQYISFNSIPICVVIIDNKASGMIMNWEIKKYGYDLHTTQESGYGTPNFEQIASGYGIKTVIYSGDESLNEVNAELEKGRPTILLVKIDQEELYPSLPMGNPCSDLFPLLPREEYGYYSKM